MIDEIIKLIEYITSNAFFRGAVIMYAAFILIVVALAITFFVVVIKNFLKAQKEINGGKNK